MNESFGGKNGILPNTRNKTIKPTDYPWINNELCVDGFEIRVGPNQSDGKIVSGTGVYMPADSPIDPSAPFTLREALWDQRREIQPKEWIN